jgi:Acyl-CoA carboxylase epsilon subunit
MVRVVRGAPTSEELAAVIAVITAGSRESVPGPAPVRGVSGWTDRSRYVGGAHSHRPGGWRAAAFPR